MITLPYPPSSNRYWRRAGVHIHKSNEARAYQNTVALMARAKGMRPIAGNVAVTLRFYRPAKRGDLDNMQKVILDALKGVGYHDDRQIVTLNASRADDAKNPRAEVEITADLTAPYGHCSGCAASKRGRVATHQMGTVEHPETPNPAQAGGVKDGI